MIRHLYRYRNPKNNNFKDQIKGGRAYVCAKHFDEGDIHQSSQKSWLWHGVLPKLHHLKSIPDKPSKERREVVKHDAPILPKKNRRSLQYVAAEYRRLSSTPWHFTENGSGNPIEFILPSRLYLSDLKVFVLPDLSFSATIFGIPIPQSSLKNLSFLIETLSNNLAVLQSFSLCQGSDVQSSKFWFPVVLFDRGATGLRSFSKRHLSMKCHVVVEDPNVTCEGCKEQLQLDHYNGLRCQEKRIEHEELDTKRHCYNDLNPGTSEAETSSSISFFRTEQPNYGNTIDVDCQTDHMVATIISDCKNDKFLTEWSATQARLRVVPPSLRRYPASIVRYCLKIFNKSPAAYTLLRDSGVLVLPSRQRISQERNQYTPSPGVLPHVLQKLREISVSVSNEHERIALVVLDEMKIKESIIYRKHTGELVGFVDFGDETMNLMVRDTTKMASHVLAVYVRGVTNNALDNHVAYYPTSSLRCEDMITIILDLIRQLEMEADIHVYGVIADGLPANRKAFCLLAQNEQQGPSFRMKNPFDLSRYLYLINDPPHLLKNVRNNLVSKNKKLWNLQPMWWEPIKTLISSDVLRLPRRFPKLTLAHAQPNGYEKMKVNLAAQALSRTITIEMKARGYEALANFIFLIDRWFDVMNTGLWDHKKKRKPDMAPFTDAEDERLKWLSSDIPKYFQEWRQKGSAREDFNQSMLLTENTENGIVAGSLAMSHLVQDCLKAGASYVLTRRCNQDCLEAYFGQQRSLGGRNNNPTVVDFGYNSNTISSRRSVKGSNVTVSS